MIVLTTALINYVVFNQFLGLCSFLGVSRQTETVASLGGAVIFVITIASGVANLLYTLCMLHFPVSDPQSEDLRSPCSATGTPP